MDLFDHARLVFFDSQMFKRERSSFDGEVKRGGHEIGASE